MSICLILNFLSKFALLNSLLRKQSPPTSTRTKNKHVCAKTTWNNSNHEWIQQKVKIKIQSSFKFTWSCQWALAKSLISTLGQFFCLQNENHVLFSIGKSSQMTITNINATEITDYPDPCDALMGMILLCSSIDVFPVSILIASENKEMSSLKVFNLRLILLPLYLILFLLVFKF